MFTYNKDEDNEFVFMAINMGIEIARKKNMESMEFFFSSVEAELGVEGLQYVIEEIAQTLSILEPRIADYFINQIYSISLLSSDAEYEYSLSQSSSFYSNSIENEEPLSYMDEGDEGPIVIEITTIKDGIHILLDEGLEFNKEFGVSTDDEGFEFIWVDDDILRTLEQKFIFSLIQDD